MSACLTPGTMHLHSFCLLSQHLLRSSSRDRDGKATKDDKGKNDLCVQQVFKESTTILKSVFQIPTLSSGAASGTGSSSRNIWVSGLSSNTKAADLKNLFGKYGKVDASALPLSHLFPFRIEIL